MYCSNCGEGISENAEICPKCGVRQYRVKNFCYSCGQQVKAEQEICIGCGVGLKKAGKSTNSDAKEPWLMVVLSFLITGLGQMVLGQVKKGVAILLGSIVLAFFTLGFSAFITTPLTMIDAYKIASKLKAGQSVDEWEFF